jgi:hypothetical protein
MLDGADMSISRSTSIFVMLFAVTLLATAPIAIANSPTVWCEPLMVPPGTDVSIHITAAFSDTNINKIEVTNPVGTVWTWTGLIELPDVGDEITVIFPSGQAQVDNDPDGDVDLPSISWPSANTDVDGRYTIYVYGDEQTPAGTANFDVSNYFGVPEFGLMMPVVASLGFIGYAVLRRRPI